MSSLLVGRTTHHFNAHIERTFDNTCLDIQPCSWKYVLWLLGNSCVLLWAFHIRSDALQTWIEINMKFVTSFDKSRWESLVVYHWIIIAWLSCMARWNIVQDHSIEQTSLPITFKWAHVVWSSKSSKSSCFALCLLPSMFLDWQGRYFGDMLQLSTRNCSVHIEPLSSLEKHRHHFSSSNKCDR